MEARDTMDGVLNFHPIFHYGLWLILFIISLHATALQSLMIVKRVSKFSHVIAKKKNCLT